MTPEHAATIPVGNPPPGKVSNLQNPPSAGGTWIGVIAVLMVVMLIFTGLRFYVMRTIKRAVTPDDWTTVIAVIGACLSFVACILAVKRAKYGTHYWNVSIADTPIMNPGALEAGTFLIFITIITLPFAKSSFFLMYLRLFRPNRTLRYAAYTGLALNWAFFIGALCTNIYLSILFRSQIPKALRKRGSRPSPYIILGPAIGSFVLDICIFVLPITPVWQLQMAMKERIRVIAVFATGLIACVASSLNIYFRLVSARTSVDQTYSILPAIGMILVELCVGVSASCMPTIAPLFRNRTFKYKSLFTYFSTKFSRLYSWSQKSDDTSQTTSHSSSPVHVAHAPAKLEDTP